MKRGRRLRERHEAEGLPITVKTLFEHNDLPLDKRFRRNPIELTDFTRYSETLVCPYHVVLGPSSGCLIWGLSIAWNFIRPCGGLTFPTSLWSFLKRSPKEMKNADSRSIGKATKRRSLTQPLHVEVNPRKITGRITCPNSRNYMVQTASMLSEHHYILSLNTVNGTPGLGLGIAAELPAA